MRQKKELLYEGKAKRVYLTEDPNLYLIEFKDDATAFDGLKKGTIIGKGEINARLSALLFRALEREGIATHFVELVSPREILAKALKILPLEVVVRNVAAGSLAQRLGLPEGTDLKRPVLEFYYKSDELHDPLLNEYHIAALELATPEQVETLKERALKINEILRRLLEPAELILVDFKLEFGLHQGEILLGDEISPDTCRFWDKETREKLDKDRFRRDLGGVEEAYALVYQRISKVVG
ncbi:MAG: phosphoribosylaminoimidazolesuccinocarboxamide synthase [Moorellaceae bacterium]